MWKSLDQHIFICNFSQYKVIKRRFFHDFHEVFHIFKGRVLYKFKCDYMIKYSKYQNKTYLYSKNLKIIINKNAESKDISCKMNLDVFLAQFQA